MQYKPSSKVAVDDDYADSPSANHDLDNSSIDKNCKPISKEDTKEQLQPSNNSPPREESTHIKV